MSGCFGGCAGTRGRRTGISQDSSHQEGFGSHCQQLQSPPATGRVVEPQPGRTSGRGEQGRAEDGVALATMGGTCPSALPGSPVEPRSYSEFHGGFLWDCSTFPSHISSRQLCALPLMAPSLLSQGCHPPGCPSPTLEHNRRPQQLSLLSDSVPGWSCHPAPTAFSGPPAAPRPLTTPRPPPCTVVVVKQCEFHHSMGSNTAAPLLNPRGSGTAQLGSGR